MKIYGAINSVMKEVEAIGKDKRNQQQGFQYRGIDDVYNQLHPILAKHGVFTVPEVLEERTEERQTKSGSALLYRIMRIKYTFFADDGSSFSAIVIGEGMDSGDKASNKAMSIAHKYALFQVFCIPTEDMKDPDAESHTVQPKKPADSAPEAEVNELLKEIDKATSDQLEAIAERIKGKYHGTQRDKIAAAYKFRVTELSK